jgi:hypothetical protein
MVQTMITILTYVEVPVLVGLELGQSVRRCPERSTESLSIKDERPTDSLVNAGTYMRYHSVDMPQPKLVLAKTFIHP